MSRFFPLHHRIFWCLAGVLAVASLTCAPSRVEIQPAGRPTDTPTFPDYDPAGSPPELMLAIPGAPPFHPGPGLLSNALSHMLEGNFLSAANCLSDDLSRLEPGSPRTAAADLLGENLFLLGDWAGFLRYTAHYSPGLDDDRVLAEAFNGQAETAVVIPTNPTVLPVTKSPIGTPVLTVGVNGRTSRFWLDTGAGITVLTETAARRGGVAALGAATTADTSTRHKVVVRAAIIREFCMGDIVFHNLPAIVLADRALRFPGPLGHSVSVDGLVGWNVLRHVAVDLDLTAGTCRFSRSRAGSGGRRNFFWLGYPCVTATLENGRSLVFGLDTGATSTSLRPPLVEKLNHRRLGWRNTRIAGAGGVESRDVLVVSRLTVTLAGQTIVWRDLAVWPAAAYAMTPLDGVLGADLLATARMELDPAAGRLVLHPHRR